MESLGDKTESLGEQTESLAIIKLPQDKAQKILETLSAFKSFKKPTSLPDRLRLTKKNILSVRRWTAMAKRKVRKGTFSSMQSLIGYFPQIEKVTEVEKEDTRLSEMKEETVQSETAQSEMAREDTTVSQGEKQESLPEVQLNQDIPTFNFNAFDDLYAESDSDWASSSDEEDFDTSRDLQTELAPQVKRMADGMGGVMTEIASEMIPITDKMITKEKAYGPYKAGLLAMEQWVEKNRERFTPDELGRREKQLECYQNIVKIYDSMEDDEPEELNKAHNTELRRLMQEIQKCGQLPYEVQSVQDAEAQKTFNPEDMQDILTPMIGNMGNALTKMMGGMGAMFGGEQGGNVFDMDSDDENGGSGDCTIL